MGVEKSVSFKRGDSESAILANHYGDDLHEKAIRYINELKAEKRKVREQYLMESKKRTPYELPNGREPLFRFVPQVVMVDFVRWLTCNFWRADSDYALFNKDAAVDTDGGHLVIEFFREEGGIRIQGLQGSEIIYDEYE